MGPYITLVLLCTHRALFGKFVATLVWTIWCQLLMTNLLKHHYLLTKVLIFVCEIDEKAYKSEMVFFLLPFPRQKSSVQCKFLIF
jgi:hypothetical protein